jgi:hypothetical protein
MQKAIPAIFVIGCLTFAGCGGDEAEAPEPSHPVTEVVHRLQQGFADRNVPAVCELMSRPAQLEAGEVAHSSPTTCVKDVTKVFGMIDKGGGWLDADPPRVAAVHVSGDSARAVLAAGEWHATIPFEKSDGEWKASSFIGMGPQSLEAAETQIRDGVQPSGGKRVRVSTYGKYTCAPIADDYPKISGGCVLRVSDTGPVPVEMLTPYGAFKFGDCFVDYRISVGEDGSTWTDEWEVEGSSESGCSDVNPCVKTYRDGRLEKLPWRGRIVMAPNGDLLHHTKACIRTCVGAFAGDLVVRLVEEDGRWRVEPADVGATGFKLNAPLDVYGLPFKMRVAKSTR